MSSKYTTQINNYFQVPGRDTSSLTFEESREGTSDRAVWTVVCKIAGVRKGTGRAATKAEAKNTASKEALEALGETT